MTYLSLIKCFRQKRLAPTLVLVAITLQAHWMGFADGGYFLKDWALVMFILATLALIGWIVGMFRVTDSSWASTVALILFATYTAWEFASLLWSPNQGDAWVGSGQTLLYLLAFWLAINLLSRGAARTWVLAASAIVPALVTAFTLLTPSLRLQDLFLSGRLLGSVGYFNGEAAFLLTPFWVGVYLAGSRRVNPILRGGALAASVLGVEAATLTQSRGAAAAMAISLPIYFLISNQRLRGLVALAPVVAALLATFTSLNEVYLAYLNQKSVPAAVEQVLPIVWLSCAIAGLYGILWGFIDQRWRPPRSVVRAIGGVVLAGSIVAIVFGSSAVSKGVGNPLTLAKQKWEAFKANPAPEANPDPEMSGIAT